MRLYECSAGKLKRMSRKRKIICFGAGERLQQIFSAFSDMGIEENVAFIVDNDTFKWGKYRDVNGKRIVIKPPDTLKGIKKNKYIVLITACKYNEIFAQIQNLIGSKKVCCIKSITYRYRITFLIESIVKLLPLHNSIVFHGEGDTCENAVAFAHYLKEHGYLRKGKIYWLCNNPQKYKDSAREKYIARDAIYSKVSFRQLILYMTALNRSKYLIFENQMIRKRRDEQISIYLNHGSPPLKATKGMIILPSNLNYAVCPSINCTDILVEQYGINKERLLYCGSPRTDVLFEQTTKSILSEMLHVSKYRKVILWVPTFRQHFKNGRIDTERQYESGMPVLETAQDWEELTKFLSINKVLLIIKPHFLQKIALLKVPKNENIIFITQPELDELHSNVYDLMKLCDGMITDYSTIAFDYMLLNRPIGYTVDDMGEYRIGFSVPNPLDYMPGEKIVSTDEYISYLDDVCNNRDIYAEERKRISQFVHGNFIDGKNCRRLAELIHIL